MDLAKEIEIQLRKLEGKLCEVRVGFQQRARQNDSSLSVQFVSKIHQIQAKVDDLQSSLETTIHSSTASLNETDSAQNTETICNQAERFANLKSKISKRQTDIITFELRLAKLEEQRDSLPQKSHIERHWLKQIIAEQQIYLRADIKAFAKRDETLPNECKEQIGTHVALIKTLEEKLSTLEKETKCNNQNLAKLQVDCRGFIANESLMAQHTETAIEQMVDVKAMKRRRVTIN